MSTIRVEHISHTFGHLKALDDVSFEIRDREVVTIVGPSGCGKSTLLRILAGLEQPTSGTLRIEDEVVNAVPTRLRNVAMVFQSYALYPHMTARENLALNLQLSKLPPDEIERRVLATARTLEIEELLDKKPKQLSGGQRQRVAVGRALIRNPRLFLFDEPLSNLDALLRERVRHELKELFRKVHATVAYVTHDQIEALTLADRVVVLDRGRVQQIGSPDDLYRFPENRFVGSFIGSPAMNLLPATLDSGRFALGPTILDTGVSFSGPADIGIRPEAIQLDGDIPAAVTWIENLGLHSLIGLEVDGQRLTAFSRQRPASNNLNISVDAKDVHVFEKDSGANLSLRRDRHTLCS